MPLLVRFHSHRLQTVNHVANCTLIAEFRRSTPTGVADMVRAMHHLPIIAALLISLVLGAATTTLVAQREAPPVPGFAIF